MSGRSRLDDVLTFGVEEELLLVDRDSGVTVPCAAEVLAQAAPALGQRVGEEFYATQVEIRTVPAQRACALRADLAQARRLCAAAAAPLGAAPAGSGCAVLTSPTPRLTGSDRYRAVARRLAPFVRATDSELSGCHVHLGTLERGEALALSARLRSWLPILQALAVNSPFSAGRERGWASWRAAQYARWPTVGPAPVVDEPGYETLARRMVAAGEVRDRKMIYWYARPSERWPTLEVRLCDVNADLDLDVLVAVLLRGLGTVLLAEFRAGREEPDHTEDAVLLDVHDQAGRHGLRGRGLDPATGLRAPFDNCLSSLVERARPGLRAAGDEHLADRLVAQVRRVGSGADRQRAVFARHGDLRRVAAELAAVTADC
ncbi:carboxylate-amine ligase [Streptacidiphilus neutrinimicus]|uniref:carboxylate-amine ligase n=1 Tax=Streptacidiphilus neutrinimicus TaxID=105420 RepID=UPI0005A9E30E|nr:YbdK family carboxylate-amine ligase [Streptacidiphilus neutrinimicus]